jgi:hypothetical protein
MRFQQMTTELLAWRPDVPTKYLVQDTLMSLWFIWLYWMRTKNDSDLDLSKWRMRKVPYGRPLVDFGGRNG